MVGDIIKGILLIPMFAAITATLVARNTCIVVARPFYSLYVYLNEDKQCLPNKND